MCCDVLSRSVMSDSLWRHGLWPGSSVHGILQARILEWVAMPSSRGSFQCRGQTQVSHIAGGFFTSWATREALTILRRMHTYIDVWPWLSFAKTLLTKTQMTGQLGSMGNSFASHTHRPIFLTGRCEGEVRSPAWGATVTSVLWNQVTAMAGCSWLSGPEWKQRGHLSDTASGSAGRWQRDRLELENSM